MRAGSRSFLAVAFAAAALLAAACAGGRGDDGAGADSLTGPITSIEPREGDIESFELETDGPPARIYIDSELDYGFDLQHLHQHMETGDPVRVKWEDRNGDLFATEIEDA